MSSPNTGINSLETSPVDAAELDPERVRTALSLNKWGGRFAASAGAMLPACLILLWTYFESLRGSGTMNPASPVGVVLTMAYFAVLQYMLFLVGGALLKTRYELHTRLEELQRELYRGVSAPAGPSLLQARYEVHGRLERIEQALGQLTRPSAGAKDAAEGGQADGRASVLLPRPTNGKGDHSGAHGTNGKKLGSLAARLSGKREPQPA